MSEEISREEIAALLARGSEEMTREEAIDYNKNLRMYMRLSDKNQPCKFLEENYIALDMAIKALEQDCDTCEVGNPCMYCKHEFEPQESEEQA